jgi:FtsP/CotA-like multicopper oxidase with cupredoxin domain
VNQAGISTIVHWHGQLPPWRQDGFPWPQTPSIPAGDTRSYDYAPIAGTYWMHSHQGMQEQSLMTAPLIVRSAEDMRADRQEVVLMLHDFSFQTPDELLAGLTKKSNGGQNATPMGNSMKIDSGSMGAMTSGTMGAMNEEPGSAMDLNDIDYDAFLANDRTFSDPADQRCVGDAVLDRSRCAQRHRCRRRRPCCSTSARQPFPACHGAAA